jgi:hypothetical protein
MPMDETITSFSDRLIELFERIKENNGGKKFYSNNRLVYRIPAERPINIEKLISAENECTVLGRQLENEMTTNLLKGDRAEKARAAYYAVCLDMAKDLSEKYPAEWKQAVTDLSGYWKVMNNVFYGNDFLSLDVLRKKFLNSGFKKPEKEYSANEMYTVENVWKEPK